MSHFPKGGALYRALWLTAGLALVGLAVLGALLPGLPTTVFAIGAAGCFARSSPRLEAWLLRQPRLGPGVVAWRLERAIPVCAKRVALASMLGSGLFLALTAPVSVALGVGLCLVLSGLYVWTRPEPSLPVAVLPEAPPPEAQPPEAQPPETENGGRQAA